MDVEIISSLTTSLGVLGALVWYLYYNTTKTLPDLTQQHVTHNKEITTMFAETLREEREFRRAELNELKGWIRDEGCRYKA